MKASVTDDITATVVNYKIIIEPLINITFEANDSSICSNFSCKYEYEILNQKSKSDYSVSIMAKNILADGYSQKQECNNRIHGEKHWSYYFIMMNKRV